MSGQSSRVKESLCAQFGVFCETDYFNLVPRLNPLFIGTPEDGVNNTILNDLIERLNSVPFGATDLPSGYVYLGQFLAHDVSSLPRGNEEPMFESLPLTSLGQGAEPALDLDSVYGGGRRSGEAEVRDGKMMLGPDASGAAGPVDYDLPRDVTGIAKIGDHRNDENVLIAQLHVQFLKLHNYFFDELAKTAAGGVLSARQKDELYEQARLHLQLYYQEVIIYDLLREILDSEVWNYYFEDPNSASILDPHSGGPTRIPIEFSGAVLRCGHSMVRETYSINRDIVAGSQSI